jgi:hypothetical protein
MVCYFFHSFWTAKSCNSPSSQKKMENILCWKNFSKAVTSAVTTEQNNYMCFEVSMKVTMKITIFWDVPLHSIILCRWRQQIPLKHFNYLPVYMLSHPRRQLPSKFLSGSSWCTNDTKATIIVQSFMHCNIMLLFINIIQVIVHVTWDQWTLWNNK